MSDNAPRPPAARAETRTPPQGLPTLAAGWVPNPRRILWPFLFSAIVVAGTWTPPGELRDAATLDPVTGMRLVYSDPYIWLAPWFDLMDALGMLTQSQHEAMLGTVVLAHVVVRVWRVRGRGRRAGVRIGREALLLLGTAAGLALMYATALLVPRPMAKLVVFDHNTLILDVHARTQYASDGRPGFTPAWRRAWSARAGYHAAYITDDRAERPWPQVFRDVRTAMAGNPRRAGEGFVALPGLARTRAGQPVAVFSPTPGDTAEIGAIGASGAIGVADVNAAEARAAGTGAADASAPLIVQALPADLDVVAGRTVTAGADPLPPIGALEIANGSPQGLEQALRDRARLVRVADSLDVPLVAGSHHRGWGSTAVAWTLVTLPGWQRLTPDSLGQAIAAAFRTRGRAATRVVERRTPELARGPGLVFLGPLLLYELNATLSPSQRLSWICWIWGLYHLGPLAAAWFRGRRLLRNA